MEAKKRAVLPTTDKYHTAVKRFASDHRMKLQDAVAHIIIEFMETNNRTEYLQDKPLVN